MDMLVTHLLFPVEAAVGYVADFGASVSYTALKDQYDYLLNRCNHLLGEDLSQEEEQELSRIRPACVKAFLLLLLGTPFLPARTAKPLICCGCLPFGIWLT
jgi:hypothetical protein